MQDMMMDGNVMMWGISLFWLLVVILVVLGVAALLKYLFKR